MNEKTSSDVQDSSDGPQSEALLVLFQDGKPCQNWILSRPVTTIGRWEDNDVVVPDRWVSRHHAQIRREGRRYVIEDLDSKNGLFINRKRLAEPVVLEDGDRIQIAPRYALTFVDNEETAPMLEAQGGVVMDQDARRVWVCGKELDPPLSSAQYALLKALVDEPGRVFSHEELIAVVWAGEDPAGVSDEALNSLVRRLRRRLRSAAPGHRYILAIRGHGFKFEQPTFRARAGDQS